MIGCASKTRPSQPTIWRVHVKDGFSTQGNAVEPDLVAIGACVGRATYFIVTTLADPADLQFEQCSQAYHGSDEHQYTDHHSHNHAGMFERIASCHVLISGDMAYAEFESNGCQFAFLKYS